MLSALLPAFSLWSLLRICWQLFKLSTKLALLILLMHYLYYQYIWKRFISPSPKPFDQYLRERAREPGANVAPAAAPHSKAGDVRRADSVPALLPIVSAAEQPIEQFLATVRIFTYLDPIISKQVVSAADEIKVGAGEQLTFTSVKDAIPDVYILKQGRFRICSPAIGDASGVEVSGTGDFLTSLFELIMIVAGRDQSGLSTTELFPKTITATTDSLVVRIPGEQVKEICLAHPSEAYNSVRIVLTRFQRIICSKLFSHFGLNTELYDIDQALSQQDEPEKRVSMNGATGSIGLADARTALLDGLMRCLGIEEAEWDRLYQILDMERDITVETLPADSEMPVDGFFMVLSGRVKVCLHDHCTAYGPRGLFGSTMGIFGSKPVCTATALESSTLLLHLSQNAVMRIFERRPKCHLSLAMRLLPRLSPLVCFVDMTLEWLHVNAGAALCETGNRADSLFIVIHGRLRLASPEDGTVLAEIGPGETFGEAELFQDLPWPGTLFAVRYAELVRVPKDLFELLLRGRPEAGLRLAKVIASRMRRGCSPTANSPLGSPRIATIRTLAILPASNRMASAAEELCRRLGAVINQTDACIVLTKAAAVAEMGRHIFTAFGKIKLIEWLNLQEDMHRVVIYLADTPQSPWTYRCMRQADCVFVVADARDEPTLGEYEHQLLAIPSSVRIELILLHQARHCPAGLTRRWLEARPWVAQHHHMVLSTSRPGDDQMEIKRGSRWKIPELNWAILADQLMTQGFRRTLRQHLRGGNGTPAIGDHAAQDAERLARRVLGTSVGLVLGGGGARGLAHVGILKILNSETAGIPVDAIGGTSIGALVGGLYARDANLYTTGALLRVFSALMSSRWRLAYDLTYPFCAWFTGESFNRALWRIFAERLIEDMWIPFFCITTDISHSKMTVHQSGLAWRAIRASMSLSGFLPPLWDEGNRLLLDGGYTNNLPVDVMLARAPHVSKIIAVDVGSERADIDEAYPDEVSGSWLLLKRLLGLRNPVPNLADIQGRLAYVSCAERIALVKEQAQRPASGIHYLRPPVQAFATLEFDKFNQIVRVGEVYATELVSAWKQSGVIDSLRPAPQPYCPPGMEPITPFDGGDDSATINTFLLGDQEDRRASTTCVRRRRRSL